MYIFEINLKNSPSAPHPPHTHTPGPCHNKEGSELCVFVQERSGVGKSGWVRKGIGHVFSLSVGHRREGSEALKAAETERRRGHLEESSGSR